MKLKILLTTLLMATSMSVNADCDPFFDDNCEAESATNQAESNNQTEYYPTGKVKEVKEFSNGKLSKQTDYYETGEVQAIDKYINGKLSEATNYTKNGKVLRDPFFNEAPNKKIKAPNKKIVMTCVGTLYNMGIAAFDSTPDSNDDWNDMLEDSYWEDVTITENVLTAPEFGDYLYRGEKDGKKYWKSSAQWQTGNPADEKYNWAKLDLNTDKFEISIQKGPIFIMQGKCSPKGKTTLLKIPPDIQW